MPISVSIVEDDDLVRESVAILIGGADGFSCAGAYATAEDALEHIPGKRPDVVLMDIRLPNLSGVECVRRLKQLSPAIQVIMLTMYDDDSAVFEALQAGASGYLLKRTPHVQILAAIEEVHRGGSPMSSAIARKVVQFVHRAPAANPAAGPALPHFSPRENEILAYLAKGYRYKEIAETLGIDIETVRTHLRRIYEKLQVGSRTEAVVKFLNR